jgi:hypothetical protein
LFQSNAPLFRSGLPKTVDFGKIANDHLEIIHEGFGKDFHGHVMKEEDLLNPNPLRNRRSDAYESVCKQYNFWKVFGRIFFLGKFWENFWFLNILLKFRFYCQFFTLMYSICISCMRF